MCPHFSASFSSTRTVRAMEPSSSLPLSGTSTPSARFSHWQGRSLSKYLCQLARVATNYRCRNVQVQYLILQAQCGPHKRRRFWVRHHTHTTADLRFQHLDHRFQLLILFAKFTVVLSQSVVCRNLLRPVFVDSRRRCSCRFLGHSQLLLGY